MRKELKNNFMQTFGGTLVWVLFLATLFVGKQPVTMLYFWKLTGIALLCSCVFGLLYKYLWDYSTLKATGKIVVSVSATVLVMFTSVWLFSPEMFKFITPYAAAIIALTIILHVIAFYLYTNYENKKNAKELNNLMK